MEQKKCRLLITNKYFLDLGVSPLANSFIAQESSYKMEPFYPLHTFVCNSCLLVQLDEFGYLTPNLHVRLFILQLLLLELATTR